LLEVNTLPHITIPTATKGKSIFTQFRLVIEVLSVLTYY
jgi:hypothetical protein